MKVLSSDNEAPDFTLRTVEGETLGLYETLQDSSTVLLIFLRHLG